jgi:CheY-like chemotaxis protein
LELNCHVKSNVPDQLLGDPMRLGQIVINIVGNAIKFTDKGEVVLEVAVESKSGKELLLRFSVRDTGIGIPQDKLNLIFDSFTQADTSTSRKYGGTGLGLTISSRLAEMMGGRVWAESEFGKGSTFHFTALFSLHDEKPLTKDQAPVADLKGIRVLVVDDNDTNRKILQEMLSSWGMKPILADSGAAALTSLDESNDGKRALPLILIDAHMPGMDGFTLAEKIIAKQAFRDVPIIMLTSAGQPGDIKRCREMGFAAYLSKPATRSELLDAISTAVRRATETASRKTSLADAAAPKDARSSQVLLAEDNLVNQTLATILLEKQGYSVTVVSDGKQALAALDKSKFDIVLMDIQMPELDGIGATAAIRAKEKETGFHMPIVAMTAHAMKGDREFCLASGMDAYLSKPIRGKELYETMDGLLRTGAAPQSGSKETLQSDSALFDEAALLEQVNGSYELACQIVNAFLEESPELMSRVRVAVQQRNAVALRQAAHALKGAVSNFTSGRPFEVVVALETMARNQELSSVEKAGAEVEQEVGRLQKALLKFTKAGVLSKT